jgi:hypothetical protein
MFCFVRQRDSICYGSKIMQATEACFSILSQHGCVSWATPPCMLWQHGSIGYDSIIIFPLESMVQGSMVV